MTFYQIACSVLLGLRQLPHSTESETLILPNHAGVLRHLHPADDEEPFSDEEELPLLPGQVVSSYLLRLISIGYHMRGEVISVLYISV